jgi:hypothetical protein
MADTTSPAAIPVDLTYRPKAYFWPLGLEKQLLTHIKGAQRRATLKRLIDAGQLDQMPDILAKAKLSDAERAAIGRIHPAFMGGEYLPDMTDDEVEIARIEIRSTTSDVTSVYARRNLSDGTIHYRVVDEYAGETLSGNDERDSDEPLTLAELTAFFLGSWSLFDCLEMNFEADTEQMLAFYRGLSEFYPDFDRHLRQLVLERFPPLADADEEDDDVR